MLYKPNFCCECGEKIERDKWTLLTSRRFCDDCAPQHESANRWKKGIAGGVLVIIGIFLGQIPLTMRTPVVTTNARNLVSASPNSQPTNQQTNSKTQTSPVPSNTIAQTAVSPTVKPATSPPPALQQQPEAVYYCGAKTQKGTPCTHRVRGGGRCWQHQGKTAMLPPEKLLIQTTN